MADITRAFENLNRSLRHISDTNRLKQQAAMQHEEKMEAARMAANDPRKKLEKLKALKEMQPTAINLPWQFGTGDVGVSKQLYNKDYAHIVNGLLPDDAEEKDGRIVFKGTETQYTQPRFEARKLQSTLDVAKATSSLRSYKHHQKGLQLQRQKKALSDTTNGDDKFKDQKMRAVEDQIKEHELTSKDPNKMAAMLESGNMELNQTLAAMSMVPGGVDPNTSKMVLGMLNQNNKRLLALASQGATNYKTVTFHRKQGKGYITKQVAVQRDVTPPNQHTDKGGTWTRGNPKGMGSGDGSSALPTAKYFDQLVRRDTQDQIVIAAAKLNITKEDDLKSLVLKQGGGDMSDEKAKFIVNMFKTNKANFVRSKKEEVDRRWQLNSQYKAFSGWRTPPEWLTGNLAPKKKAAADPKMPKGLGSLRKRLDANRKNNAN